MGGDDAIKVAVRVRPFNDREKNRNATLVIEMNGKTTLIKDPNNLKSEPKSFAFDQSYWSHDGFNERPDGYMEKSSPSSNYADQRRVFDDLGRGVLDNAWAGYNCSLFAYGQTGSGKSYSMVGFGSNKGIIPIVCDELFKQIDTKKSSDTEHQVSVAMFEIYCERVRDLLSTAAPPKGGLKVREDPKKGFYVQDLRICPVNNYAAIEAKTDEGNKNRTIAATNMNATSSRAHTIVQIAFAQKTSSTNTTKTSLINLVDLAGSERQAATGAEGDRLKEGIVINQSLSTLGRCIKALHEQQTSKGGKEKIQVPYRDSVLTSLLKNALGGNSKTVMIAALSPADINYDETLSTLRFADRAKSIKTNATVNESATDRLIRELREENQRLMQQMKAGGIAPGAGGDDDDDNEEIAALRAQLEANKREMEANERSWKERLEKEAKESKGTTEQRVADDSQRASMAHFWNLNEDPTLTNVVVHFIKEGDCRVGNKSAAPPADIVLTGLSIQPEHAMLKNKGQKKVTVTALSGAQILVNGKEISKETELNHNDRVLFGGNHLYVFSMPNPKKKFAKLEITWDMAQNEIAKNSGLTGIGNGRSKEDLILQEELVQTMPKVQRANAMSKELRKDTKFEIVLVAPLARGQKTGVTEIWVKAINTREDTEFLWDNDKFNNRYFGMQELYQNYSEGFKNWDVTKDRDPFYEPPDSEMIIGGVTAYLRSLAYMVESDEQIAIVDFQGQERGQIKVGLYPCTPQGKEITGDFVDNPEDLVGKNLSFKVKINEAVGLPRKFVNSRCRFKFYLEEKPVYSMEMEGSNPKYRFEKTFQFKPVTKQLIEHLETEALYIEVLGKQAPKGARGAAADLTVYNQGAKGGGAYTDKADQLEKKLNKIQRLLDDALKSGQTQLNVKDLQKTLADTGAVDARRKSMAAAAAGGGGAASKPKRNGSLSGKSADSGFSDDGKKAAKAAGSSKGKEGGKKSRSNSKKRE